MDKFMLGIMLCLVFVDSPAFALERVRGPGVLPDVRDEPDKFCP